MKKLISILLVALSFTSYAQTAKPNTGSNSLTTDATRIKNETVPAANTPLRVGTHLLDQIASQVNINQYAGVVASGTNTYTANTSPAITALPAFYFVRVIFTNANTTASTFNFCSTGAKDVKKLVSGSLVSLSSGDIGGTPASYLLMYNGTNWQIMNGGSTGGGGGGGTVLDFSAGDLSPLFTSSVATSTTTPALTFNLSTAGAHKWFGNNTGSAGAPGYSTIGSADIGATTVGYNVLTLTNPSAVTFPRFNADNTVSARTAAQIRSDIGAAGALTNGSGTTANGTAVDLGGAITANTSIPLNDNINLEIGQFGGSTYSAYFNMSRSSSFLTGAAQMVAYGNSSSNTIGAVYTNAGNGTVSTGMYTYLSGITRQLLITTTDVTFDIGSDANGDIYQRASGKFARLASVATGNALISGGVTTPNSWGKIGLTTHVSGTLAPANGGTGLASLTTYGLIAAGTTSTGTFQQVGSGTSGQVLTSNGGGALPTFQNISGGGISGLTTNRIPYATSSSALGDDALMTWDPTNKAPSFNNARILTISTSKGFYFGNGAGTTTAQTTSTGNNTGFGYQAMNAITDGASSFEASDNTGTGYRALKSLTTGFGNTAFGSRALETVTTSRWLTAVGHLALNVASSTFQSVAVGNNAMKLQTGGQLNVAVGSDAMSVSTISQNNTMVGANAGAGIITGSYNTGVGSEVLESLASGAFNTVLGYVAGVYITGDANTLIGGEAGAYNLTSGHHNTYVGRGTNQSSGTQYSYSTVLGYDGLVTSSRTMIFGSDSTAIRPNYGFGGESFGSGFGVMYLANATTNPTTAASGGNYWYAKSGTIYFAPNTTVSGFNPGSFAGNPSSLNNGDIWYNSSSGDLNARIAGSTVSLSPSGTTAPFSDATSIVKGSSDATKLLRFEVDGFTTATTRVATFPNADITVARIDAAQTFTGVQTFSSAPVVPTGSPLSGGANAASQNYVDLAVSAGSISLGTGVATFLATPSSANLLAALTDETGTGVAVFGTSPTIATPKINQINDSNGNEEIIFTTTASAVNELTFINAVTGTAPTIQASGGDSNVGINFYSKGTGAFTFHAPSASLTNDTFYQLNTLGATHYSTDAVPTTFNFTKIRGTSASPTTDANADNLGIVDFTSYDGTASFATARIKAVLNGTVATNTLPTDLVFYTATTNSLTEALRLTSSGVVLYKEVLNNQTGTTYTLVTADEGKIVTLSNASPVTVTLNQSTFTGNAKIKLKAKGAGQVTIAAGSGITIHSSNGLKLRVQYSYAELIQTDTTDTWDLIGDVTP